MLRTLVGAAVAAALLSPTAALAQGRPSSSSESPWLAERVVHFAHQGGEDEFPSNTMYAYRRALALGADMLEVDVHATADGRLAVIHDNAVDRTTNGTGSVSDMTLAQVQALDAAHWFVPRRGTVKDAPAAAYTLRGARTGARRLPARAKREDFRVPSLDEVLAAFPDTPMNIEVKGRADAGDAAAQRTADLLAALLEKTGRRDVIVAGFSQAVIDRFHAAAPDVAVAPGIDGTAKFVLQNASPGPGVAAFQVPVTFQLGAQKLTIVTPDFVARAHEAGYAVHVWLSNDREDDAMYRRLLGMCVDGIMAAKPRELEGALSRFQGLDPCGTRIRFRVATASRAGRVELPLARQGRSKEERAGEVRLYATRPGTPTAAALLGKARFALAHGATRVTPSVRLNAAGRARLGRAGARVQAVARVVERGRVVQERVIVVRGAKATR